MKSGNEAENRDRIFAAALRLGSATDRRLFLEEACKENRALRGEIESLLLALEQAGDFLSRPLTWEGAQEHTPYAWKTEVADRAGTAVKARPGIS